MPRHALLVLVAAVAACAVMPAAAMASASQVMTFEAPEVLDDGARDRTLDEIRAFGVTSLRTLVYWKSTAPSPDSRTRPDFDASDPAAYPAGTWDRYDRLLDAAAARGIDVRLTPTGGAPRWATRGRRDNLTEPSPAEFGRFVTALGRRYRDRVSVWSIWNEPNQPQFLLPQFKRGRAFSPGHYRRLFAAAQSALRATGNGQDTILLGETSPRGNANIVAPLAFLRGTLCLDRRYRRARSCSRLDVDGWAHHAYTTSAGPSFVPPKRDDVTIGVLSRLVRALDRAARARAIPARLGVHLTEFGVQSRPDRIIGVPQSVQPVYMAIAERIAYRNPRVRAFSQYLMRDDQPRPSRLGRYSGFESGLRDARGRQKPAYDAFPLPLVADRRGSRVSLWGRVRPAVGPTTVTVEYDDGGSRWRVLAQRSTDRRGTWQLSSRARGGRRYRVRWTPPGGASLTGPPIRQS